MQKHITLRDRKVEYILRQNARARHMRLTVRRDGTVALTMPARFSEKVAEGFLRENEEWVISKLDHFAALPPAPEGLVLHRGRKDYLKHREQARAMITTKVEQFGALYGSSWGTVSIKNQKSCWGSCSRKRNLNFNYKTLFLPENQQDYIIVHELCHLQEFNHSKKFWELVAQTIPNHLAVRKELRLGGLNFY